jgi:biotin transporter BioY
MHNPWFEIAVITSIFAFGNVFFGHFEEHTPKWRRVAKVFLVTGLGVLISAWLGRLGFYAFLGLMALAFVVVHGWWLPKQGIHPITGEPKERYDQLRGWKF